MSAVPDALSEAHTGGFSRDRCPLVDRFLRICMTTLVLSVPAISEQLPVRSYGETDGLPHTRVRCMMRDSQGFLWFCVGDRLSRFDGRRFAVYEVGSETTSMVETSPGVYWVGTYGRGVFRFSIGGIPAASGPKPTLSAYTTGAEPDSNLVNVVYRDRNGKIWAGTDNGLYVLDEVGGGTAFNRVELGISAPPGVFWEVAALTEDRNGSLWIGGANGVIQRLPSGQTVHYVSPPEESVRFVRALMFDRNGRLWTGHNGGVVVWKPEPVPAIGLQSHSSRRFLPRPGRRGKEREGQLKISSDQGESQWFSTAQGTATCPVWGLRQYGDGLILAATMGGGLFAFGDGGVRRYTTLNGLPEDSAWCLGEDAAGNRWIGTTKSGAIRLARGGFSSYDEADGWSKAPVLSIFHQLNGDFCTVGARWRISCFNGARFESAQLSLPPASLTSPSAGQYLHPVIQDHTGEWWVASGRGVYRFPRVRHLAELAHTQPKAKFTTQHGMASNLADALFEDSRGDVWISAGGRAGQVRAALGKWERKTGVLRTYTQADGLPPFATPTAFAEDSGGNVWMGLWNGGLLRYSGSGFLELGEQDGVPRGGVHGLFRDSAGRLWASVLYRGVVRIDNATAKRPSVVSYTTSQGLASNDATCFTEDSSGRIYIGSGRGVDRLDPATGQIRHYTAALGLRNSNVRAAYRDRNGALWFATGEEMAKLVPGNEGPAVAPAIWISSIRVAGLPWPGSDLGTSKFGPVSLSRGDNQIRIDYFSLDFVVGDVLRYQYKLEGGDERDWMPPSEQSSVDFAKLAPGRYKFSVRTINADGLTSATPATAEFTIPPPLWRTWWFLGLAIMLVGAAAYQVHRYRLSRAMELERVRTRIATDLHDDIGSTLSQISVLSEVVRQKVRNVPAVEEALTSMATLSRDLLDSLNEIVWAINPHRDSLGDLAQRMRRITNDLASARPVECRFQAPASQHDLKMGADVRREVFLIFKESVTNAIRHSECKHLEIQFVVGGGWLELEVKDDGKGFDEAPVSEGNGLWSMHRRAQSLGGVLQVTSSNGAGTTVRLRAPLTRHRLLRRS